MEMNCLVVIVAALSSFGVEYVCTIPKFSELFG